LSNINFQPFTGKREKAFYREAGNVKVGKAVTREAAGKGCFI
tara:strand:- start:1564 stop:1689 length:126 start_codon:yes stop_codon:yes gene_type:complete